MNVAALQQFLRSLVGPMQAAGASQKVVHELEEAGSALEPFRDFDFGRFAAFLRQAEEYQRTGVLSIRGGRSGAGKGLDPARIHELAQQAAQLKERAAGADSPPGALGAEFDRLGLPTLTKKDVLAVAREIGARTTVRMTQDEAIASVRRWVHGQEEPVPAPRIAEASEAPETDGPLPSEVPQLAHKSAGAPPEFGERPA